MCNDILKTFIGADPMPWQIALFERFRKGELPSALDIPTGLGKTSTMAIWLAARANGVTQPRRLVYVVDRRVMVDQATGEAMRLREVVDGNRELKNKLGLRDDQSLPVSTLRGQYVDNREWLEDPVAPAIIVGTVDMIGSRLLLADTLLVLDEAHLVPPFEHLLRSIETDPAFRGRDEGTRRCVPPFRLLTLSATGRTQTNNVMELTEEDLKHGVVKMIVGPTHWFTVTPAVIDRHPKETERGLYQRDVPRMIGQASVSVELPWPREVVVAPVSAHLAVPPAHVFPRLARKDGSDRRHAHTIVVFDEPVVGPVLLGGGKYRVYGVFRPWTIA